MCIIKLKNETHVPQESFNDIVAQIRKDKTFVMFTTLEYTQGHKNVKVYPVHLIPLSEVKEILND